MGIVAGRLLTAHPSPFGHKIEACAAVACLTLEVVQVSTLAHGGELRAVNPLGKLPVLVPPGASTGIFDSRVIVEYLQSLSGTDILVPRECGQRLRALQLQALADGMADAAVLIYAECQWRPPSGRSAGWLDHQAGKVRRCLDMIARGPKPDARNAPPDVGTIALACALGYVQRRFGSKVAEAWPSAFAWLADVRRSCDALSRTWPGVPSLQHLTVVSQAELQAVLLGDRARSPN